MRVVLDTDVIVAAVRSPGGASAAILDAVDRGRTTLLLSTALALEYEAVCLLPEHRLASGLELREMQSFVDTLIGLAEPVEMHFRWCPMLRDPGDEMVLEVAVNGHADALVTFNLRDYGASPAIFGIDAMLPREALRRIRG